jgi:hypothetical protein
MVDLAAGYRSLPVRRYVHGRGLVSASAVPQPAYYAYDGIANTRQVTDQTVVVPIV